MRWSAVAVAGLLVASPSRAHAQAFTDFALWQQAVQASGHTVQQLDFSTPPAMNRRGCSTIPSPNISYICDWGDPAPIADYGFMQWVAEKYPGPILLSGSGPMGISGDANTIWFGFTPPATYAFGLWVTSSAYSIFQDQDTGEWIYDPGYLAFDGISQAPGPDPLFFGVVSSAPLTAASLYSSYPSASTHLGVSSVYYATATPEPATLALLSPALFTIGIVRRRYSRS